MTKTAAIILGAIAVFLSAWAAHSLLFEATNTLRWATSSFILGQVFGGAAVMLVLRSPHPTFLISLLMVPSVIFVGCAMVFGSQQLHARAVGSSEAAVAAALGLSASIGCLLLLRWRSHRREGAEIPSAKA